jgi:hypothetical protein
MDSDALTKRRKKVSATTAISAQKPKLAEPAPPPTDYLLELALKERRKVDLSQHANTISTLRDDKNFTFREIAGWLKDKGIEADYNAVYRVYTRHMSAKEANEVACQDRDDEGEAARG